MVFVIGLTIIWSISPTPLLRLAQKSPLVYETPPDSTEESQLVLFPHGTLLHALIMSQPQVSPQSICTFAP